MSSGWGYRLSKNNTMIHILVWLVLFSIPVLFSLNQSGTEPFSRYLRGWLPLIFSALTFYVNYLFLIDRFLFKSKYGAFILINIGVIALFVYLIISGHEYLNAKIDIDRTEMRPPPPSAMPFIFVNSLFLILTIGGAIAIKSTRQWQLYEEREKKLKQEHMESELANLKNQLNPHFFFNTLNNIYSLIPVDQDKAQEVVYRLSKMMRYLLYDSNEKFVPLEKEIEFINYYLDLMALRLSDHVEIRRSLDVGQSTLKVAPLLFISLIENAFKHGVSASKLSEIDVNIHLKHNKLQWFVRNTAFPKEDKDRSGSGIGLVNLEKRLQLLYPGHFNLDYYTENHHFEAKLELEL